MNPSSNCKASPAPAPISLIIDDGSGARLTSDQELLETNPGCEETREAVERLRGGEQAVSFGGGAGGRGFICQVGYFRCAAPGGAS